MRATSLTARIQLPIKSVEVSGLPAWVTALAGLAVAWRILEYRGAVPFPPPVPGAAGFHVAVGQSQTGPFDLGALQGQVTSGQLTRNSLVWKSGMGQWVKAGDVPELANLFASVPPPVPH